MKQCTVAFCGRRDNYEVAKAFRDAGWRTTLVTDVAFPAWLRNVPAPAKIRRHIFLRSAELEGIEVVMPPLMVMNKTLNTITANGGSLWSSERLGVEAARVANRRGGVLLCYSTYAYRAFPALRPNVRRILFQMHPHADACERILESLTGLKRGRDESIDWEYGLPEVSYQAYRQEWRNAEGILAASSFTKQTLIEAGADERRVRVVPYGATGKVSGSTDCGSRGGPLRLLFVGSFLRRKGTMELAALAERFPREQLQIHACGRGLVEPEVMAAFRRTSINIHWNKPDAHLAELREQCDAFLFPSHLEGFAHVIAESMVAGLPVITTERTCAPDLIVNGEHGWIVPAGNFTALEAVVKWCFGHRERLRMMREAVRQRGLEFTWSRFRKAVVRECENLLEL